MSTRTTSILVPTAESNGLYQFFLRYAGGLNDVGPLMDAPAFYTGVSMRYWGSGTRTKALTGPDRTISESISYDVTKSFTRRDLRDDAVFDYSTTFANGSFDNFVMDSSGYVAGEGCAPGECFIGIHYSSTARNLPHLARHYLMLRYYAEELDYNVGTQSVDYDDPGTTDESNDIITDIIFRPPRWEHATTPTNLGEHYDQWTVEDGPSGFGWTLLPLDLTGINWRDLRATFAASINDSDVDSSWDTNSVVHHVSITIS